MHTVMASAGVNWGIVLVAGVGAALVGTVLTPVIVFVLRLLRPLVVGDGGAAPNRSYRVTFAIGLVNSFLTNLLFFLLGVLVALSLGRLH